ncbi:hypothetical protein V6N11_074785 [Hibiscus sabdariffa]|uniref:Uncharacterized protein n=1 Tax=Hibiscus sabdariffa TaxID=183260 RepID=A0ABR2R4N2_9ROSI
MEETRELDRQNVSLQKIATGSIAAAFGGVSNPFYGFFDKDAEQLVGRYSIISAVIGLLALFLHTRQHTTSMEWSEKHRWQTSGKLYIQCISLKLIATVVSMVVNSRMGLVAWAMMPYHFIGGLVQAKSAKGFAGDRHH